MIMEKCGDNRFELVEKYKAKILDGTNIGQSLEEGAVIDSILFRFWQMGWLDMIEQSSHVAAEIFAEIEQIIDRLDRMHMNFGNPKQSWGVRSVAWEIAELKKKYTESEGE